MEPNSENCNQHIEKSLSKSHENINNYLDSKIPLFSNLKNHFDKVPNLKDILTSHMLSYRSCDEEDRISLKHNVKNQLTEAGVFNDQEVLEFLLLISEKKRSFEDKPMKKVSDKELCKYYFNKYKAINESWPPNNFDFFYNHSDSYQKEKTLKLEEIAIYMIVQSRASFETAIKPSPEPIKNYIETINDYFQKAFYSTFRKQPPFSLSNITYVTEDYTEHADRISGKTFINIDYYNGNPKEFGYLVLHEAMHLCFPGFKDKRLEEALIELYIEEMLYKSPPTTLSLKPLSDIYQKYKEDLKTTFKVLPNFETQLRNYFLNHDIKPLEPILETSS